MRPMLHLLAALTLATPALAGPITRTPSPMRPAVQTYRAPTVSAPRPAPVAVRPSTPAPSRPATAPTARTAPVARAATATQRTRATVAPRAKATVVRTMPPRATTGTTATQRRVVGAAATRTRPAGKPQRRSYAYRGSRWAWTAPALMPIWWMSTMDEPYTFDGYDDFIRQCLRMPENDRSDECVQALRDEGLEG